MGGEGIKNRRILPRLQRSIDLSAYSKLLACEREIKPRPTYDKSRYVGGEGFVKERERERICQREEIKYEKKKGDCEIPVFAYVDKHYLIAIARLTH